MANPEVLALIPARGGSKSVPRKNIRIIAGKPLIHYTIHDALACLGISRVVVSTDDPEIAEIARVGGAEVPFLRPAELAGDYSVDLEFHEHAIKWLQEHESYCPDMVMNLRPTTPIRNPDTLQKAINLLNENKQADSVRSVRMAELSPFKMWCIDENTGAMQAVTTLDGIAEPYNSPRQKLPVAYWQDGYVDVAWVKTLLEKRSTIGDVVLPLVIDEEYIDVDYEDTVIGADALLSGRPLQEVEGLMKDARANDKIRRLPV